MCYHDDKDPIPKDLIKIFVAVFITCCVVCFGAQIIKHRMAKQVAAIERTYHVTK